MKMKKTKCVLHSSLSHFLLADRESCRGMGRRQPKKLGAGGGAHLAGLLHVLVYIQCNKRGTTKNRFTYKNLCRCRMEKTVQENCK